MYVKDQFFAVLLIHVNKGFFILSLLENGVILVRMHIGCILSASFIIGQFLGDHSQHSHDTDKIVAW